MHDAFCEHGVHARAPVLVVLLKKALAHPVHPPRVRVAPEVGRAREVDAVREREGRG